MGKKRSSSSHHHHSSLSSINASSSKALKLSYACDDDDSEPAAAMVHFPDGEPRAFASRGLKFKSFAPRHDPSTCRILSAATHRMSWQGKNFPEDYDNESSNVHGDSRDDDENVGKTRGHRYLVAVVDRKQSKADLFEVPIFSLKSTIRYPKDVGLVDTSMISGDDKGDATATDLYLESRNKLMRAFGGKINRKQMAERERDSIRGGSLDTKALRSLAQLKTASALSTVSAAMGADDGPSGEGVSTLPPFNLYAKSAGEAYPLKGMLSEGLENALKANSKELVKANGKDIARWREEDRYGSFILSQVNGIWEMPASARNRKARLLVLVDYMIRFHQFNSHTINNSSKWSDIIGDECPRIVADSLMSTFAAEGERTSADADQSGVTEQHYQIPKSLKDKLLLWIFALSLHVAAANGFVYDVVPLIADLQLEKERSNTILRTLGMVATNKNTGSAKSRLVTVKIPLKFPTNKKRSRA